MQFKKQNSQQKNDQKIICAISYLVKSGVILSTLVYIEQQAPYLAPQCLWNTLVNSTSDLQQ